MSTDFEIEEGGPISSSVSRVGENRALYSKFEKSSETPSIISFLVRKHIVRNENNARVLLLIVALVIFAISLYFIIDSFKGPTFTI